MMYNRFDIISAWYLALCHCHAGQYTNSYERLCKMDQYFKPGPSFNVDSLTSNGKEIYDAVCKKLLEK